MKCFTDTPFREISDGIAKILNRKIQKMEAFIDIYEYKYNYNKPKNVKIKLMLNANILPSEIELGEAFSEFFGYKCEISIGNNRFYDNSKIIENETPKPADLQAYLALLITRDTAKLYSKSALDLSVNEKPNGILA